MNAKDLKKLIKSTAGQDFLVVDVREPQELQFSGSIPEAKNIPLGELESRLGELNQEQQIYCICQSGNRSQLASQLLNSHGFQAENVEGGMSLYFL